MLEVYFAKAPAPAADADVLAIISPHAGYVFPRRLPLLLLTRLIGQRNIKPFFCWQAVTGIHFREDPFIASAIMLHLSERWKRILKLHKN
jgi:hypothetical protein